jgi:hypothetical protein
MGSAAKPVIQRFRCIFSTMAISFPADHYTARCPPDINRRPQNRSARYYCQSLILP